MAFTSITTDITMKTQVTEHPHTSTYIDNCFINSFRVLHGRLN